MSNWIFETTKGTFLNVKEDGVCEDEYGVEGLIQFLYEETGERLSPDLNRVCFCANDSFVNELESSSGLTLKKEYCWINPQFSWKKIEEKSISKTFMNFIRV